MNKKHLFKLTNFQYKINKNKKSTSCYKCPVLVIADSYSVILTIAVIEQVRNNKR